MIAAIYLKETYGMLPVNAAIRVYKADKISRERRERERRQPAFNDILTRTASAGAAKRSDNYNVYGLFVDDQDQMFNKLA